MLITGEKFINIQYWRMKLMSKFNENDIKNMKLKLKRIFIKNYKELKTTV